MSNQAWGFPITGKHVSDAIKGSSVADELWQLSHLDVPSGDESPAALYELRQKVASGPAEISTLELCDALVRAPQVWVLDIRLVADETVQLHIEDGEVFEENLKRA